MNVAKKEAWRPPFLSHSRAVGLKVIMNTPTLSGQVINAPRSRVVKRLLQRTSQPLTQMPYIDDYEKHEALLRRFTHEDCTSPPRRRHVQVWGSSPFRG